LSPGDRRLLAQAGLAVLAVRGALRLLPFRVVHALVGGLGRHRAGPPGADRARIERIRWAVETAARHVAGATCLTRALAAQLLLARRGHATRLRLGVGRGPQGQFEAHAWVEDDDGPLIGAPEPGRFTPLPPLETVAR
jgi:hypothetical protein